MHTAEHEYLLVDEVATLARTSVGTVRAWLRSGRLPSVKPGRHRLVRKVDLDAFMTRDLLAERKQARGATEAPVLAPNQKGESDVSGK
jgi:excisionase family DNA binding protein